MKIYSKITYLTVISHKMHPMPGIHFGGTEIARIYTHCKNVLQLFTPKFLEISLTHLNSKFNKII